MALEGYLVLGGVEIINEARTAAYIRNGVRPSGVTFSECGCPTLGQMLGETYTFPNQDPAPWYDPAVPASADFAGMIVIEVTGLDNAPIDRPVFDRIGDGSVLGRARRRAREVNVTGILVGRTCCGIDYGIRWLSAALAGSPCEDCVGDDLCFFDCCPGSSPDPCSAHPDGAGCDTDCAKQHERTLRNVGLTDGLNVDSKQGSSCGRCSQGCSWAQVSFTLTAGDPYSYGEPCVVSDCQPFPLVPDTGECLTEWVPCGGDGQDPCDCEDGSCPDDDPCPGLPNCGKPTTAPPAYPVIRNDCVCDPLASSGMCMDIPTDCVPEWAEGVPIITVQAGPQGLRKVRARFYENPQGKPASSFAETDENGCLACAEVNIVYIPPGGKAVIDGTDRSVTIQCGPLAAYGAQNASSSVYGPDGGPYTIPVLGCGTPYVVCISADAETAGPDDCASVSVVPREA